VQYGAATKKRKSLAGKLKRKLRLAKDCEDPDEEAKRQEEEVRRKIMAEEQPTMPAKRCVLRCDRIS